MLRFKGQKKDIEHKFLGGKWPVVETAPDPELIIWKNIGVSSSSRFFRQLIVFVISMMTSFVVFYFVLILIQKRDKLKGGNWTASMCGNNKYSHS